MYTCIGNIPKTSPAEWPQTIELGFPPDWPEDKNQEQVQPPNQMGPGREDSWHHCFPLVLNVPGTGDDKCKAFSGAFQRWERTPMMPLMHPPLPKAV